MTEAFSLPALRVHGVIFALALAVRLAYFVAGPLADPGRAMSDDSTLYRQLADTLVRERTFALPAEAQSGMHAVLNAASPGMTERGGRQLVPETFRTPGYPVFIALASLGSGDIRPVLLVQCLLGATGAVLLMLLGSRIGCSPRACVAVGLIWALHPALIAFDNQLLSESLFVFCVLCAFLLAAAAASPLALTAAAALLGAATLVRPPLGLVFAPGLVALAWGRVKPVRASAAVMAGVALLVLPWMTRNWMAGEGFRLSTVGDFSVVFYTAPCAVSEAAGDDCDRSYPRRWAEIGERLKANLRPGDDPLALASTFAWRDIRQHPDGVARMYAKSMVKLSIGHSLWTWQRGLGRAYRPSSLFAVLVLGDSAPAERPPVRELLIPAAWLLANLAVAIAAVAGAVRLMWMREWRVLLVLMPPVLALLAATGAVGQERMRLPMMMSLLLLAGALSVARSSSPVTHAIEASGRRPETETVTHEVETR